MLVQVEVLSETMNVPALTREVVADYLHQVSQHHYPEIARALGTSSQQIQKVAAFISENLNPFPARAHWGDVRNPNSNDSQVFHQPDILIYHLNENPANPLVVEIILPIRGTLRVNPLFKSSLKQMEQDKTEEWRSDIEKANLLIKCIQQRSNALKLLLEKLVVIQKDYILQGDLAMTPLTRAEIGMLLLIHDLTGSFEQNRSTSKQENCSPCDIL